MKSKKLFIICGMVLILALLCIVYFLIIKPKSEEKKCEPIVGGSFTIHYNSLGGNDIEDAKVCVACSPDSYEDLPTPEKEGYVFDGWYFDRFLKRRVSGTSTLSISPRKSVNEEGCEIGYKDIFLYAKWVKEGEKTTAELEEEKAKEKADQQSAENEKTCQKGYRWNGKRCVRVFAS